MGRCFLGRFPSSSAEPVAGTGYIFPALSPDAGIHIVLARAAHRKLRTPLALRERMACCSSKGRMAFSPPSLLLALGLSRMTDASFINNAASTHVRAYRRVQKHAPSSLRNVSSR
ncbi:hypothetical protein MRX96_009635 [Rhipicephalus microplus]